ncbi:MAG: HAMP domain-containing histidine kinase [Loigolactobacillus coryniformis]|uniref:histidine kinase n=1 Tax=Loigolactobacillus coryniformis subsp. coryniformis CECT 5711 TaxID=1185325 RepID=J3JCC9_9LACO|nr:HAMP domain-containing sensor histidine kinase [Loigolactobacillus coryniformis]EJN56494.1 Sensor kinase protein [Loigolactobacillus coryniformis subsp. coryniformis CECT 5711]MDN5952646.1 HAMP domain-containing histidine kinase [Loigolactobacillus coryniformis]
MKSNNNSSAAQITRAYAWMLLALTTIISLAIITVVGYNLVENKRQQAISLMGSLQHSFIDNQPDWDYWAYTSPIDTSNTFVKITDDFPKKPTKTFYSKNTESFLDNTWDTWPLLSHIQYQDDQGFYYHILTTKTDKKGKKIHYEIWLSLNNAIHLFRLILEIIISITLLGFIVGAWLISLLAKRLNAPLVHLTVTAHKIVERPEMTHHEKLPVPQRPQEVHDLSLEFNRLLSHLNQQVIRDHQFVSDASHELRTPLAGIRGHVALIKRHGTAHPEIIANSLSFIDTESQRMQELIEDLLQLSRMDHAHLTLATTDMTTLIQTISQRYQTQIPQPVQLQLQANVSASVNAPSVEQILIGLLANASKYSPPDQPIIISLTQHQHNVYLTVADQGVGISAADKVKIFERFYRVDSSRSQKIAGTGLGLAIVARLVTLNHGKIVVTDNQPTGSQFRINFTAASPNS